MSIRDLPRPPIYLGLAGILPQALCLTAMFALPEWRWVVLAASCFYASTILSFLGGLWWMWALSSKDSRAGPYLWSVMASLFGWASLLPWIFGWNWPGPSLIALGCALLASPLIDRHLARNYSTPSGWLTLRLMMATGLGVLTLFIGLI